MRLFKFGLYFVFGVLVIVSVYEFFVFLDVKGSYDDLNKIKLEYQEEKLYPFIQAAAVMIGVLMDTSAVWIMSELVNGLMAVPNLITLFILSPQVVETVRAYSQK